MMEVQILIVYLGGARNTGVEWEMQQGKKAANQGCILRQLPLWVEELNPKRNPRELVHVLQGESI